MKRVFVAAWLLLVVQQITATEATPIQAYKPCATETSHNCSWDAQKQGNGTGRSFIDINGTVHYVGGN